MAAGIGAATMSLAGVTEPVPAPVAEQNPIRQTEAAAAVLAAKTDVRVEISAFRTETHSVFANPDGTLTSIDYAQPVRVVRDGGWVPVDATLREASDGSFVPRAAAFGLRLSGGGDGPLLTAERAGRTMSLDWEGALPKPAVTGERATYAEVLPGVDLVVNVDVTEFSHVLVIKTAEAAQNPKLASLEFGLRTKGLDVSRTEAGGLTAVDAAAGGAVFEAGTPIMWDSGAPATTPAAKAKAKSVDPSPLAAVEAPPASAEPVALGVAVTDDTLTLKPDQGMLSDPKTTFPVYVDPVWTDTRASAWAMVAKGYPNQEYWKFKGHEGVGECPVSSGTCAGTGVKRVYYTLPTSFPDRTILSAELAVTMTHTFNGSAKNVSLYRTKTNVGSGTNWNNQPDRGAKLDTKNPTATKGTCEKDNQNVRFDVRGAVDGKQASTTFLLRADNESDSTAWKRFCGNAILEVRYNRAPNTPLQRNLTNSPGGACVYGASRPFTDTPPVLNAILSDLDKTAENAEQLTAEFKIYWTPAGGAQVVRTFRTGKKASGSSFSFNANVAGLALPENTVIAWEVRANDGAVDGPWSSFGDQTRCEFVLDRTSPAAPDIDSAEYLPLDAPEHTGACVPDEIAGGQDATSPSLRGWIGRYGTFVFDSAASDAVEYRYAFDANPSANDPLKPTSDGGPVSKVWAPEEDGPHTINVQAKDRAGKSSVIASCTFYVATRLSAVDWSLDDQGPEVADRRMINPATAGADVTFGVPGPGCPATGTQCAVDRAVRLTGGSDSYVAADKSDPVVDTGAAFSVSAWVRLTDDTVDRVAVSQDGTDGPGFALGFDATTRKWTFGTPTDPVNASGSWTTTSTAPAATGEWTHLAGVYDQVKATIQLYVNGTAQPVAAKRTAWRSTGAAQLGRRLDHGGYRDPWIGDLADVNLFDRIIVAREVNDLALRRPKRVAYWPLDEQVDGQSLPYGDPDGPQLRLADGAAVRTVDVETAPPNELPMVGRGELVLDGTNDHATTTGKVATTNGSYTVSARVRLAAGACTRNMTVIAQSGSKESGFVLRCSAANEWEAVLPQLDGVDANRPPVVLSGAGTPSADSSGQQLVLVYDAVLRQATFYMNGELASTSAANFTPTWAADGSLTIGRSMRQGAYGDFFAGVVDDVRVYAGVVDPAAVAMLGSPAPDPHL